MENNNEVLLKVEHLCQYFKMGSSELKAVDDVSFEIKKGEVFGLVGESGCGKTTTGRSIIKLYDITGGDVYFKGQRIAAGTRKYKDAIKAERASLKADIASIKAEYAQKPEEAKVKIAERRAAASKVIEAERAKIASAKDDHKNCDKKYAKKKVQEVNDKYATLLAEVAGNEQKLAQVKAEYKKELKLASKERIVTQIQMIFQDPIASLDPRMTVREIIAEGLIIKGIKDKKYIDEKVYEVLEMVGLVREHADRYPHEFSGGQRQRIGVARSIIMRPELIIADEPISALDVSIQAQVINLLNDLRQQLGLTIMFIAHDLSVVKYFSDRIGVMYYGNLVEMTTSDELFAHPLHPYTRSLLSAIPLPDPVYEKNRKRIAYNPLAEHDYSVDKPSLREVKPGHWVKCNDAEFKKYQEILNSDNR